ncbi:MAG: hypothetical protein ACR2MN_17430 [Acidimicrobiales bacterium]
MRIQFPRGDTLPRGQVAAIGVIAGVLSLVVVDVLSSGMARLPAAILTLIVAVVILLIVATAIATFTAPLQRFTDRVLGDGEDREDGGAGGP